MAARIVAQLLVAGAATLLRAGTQAWQQALQNAHKTGVANEAIKTARATSTMTLQEARMILGLQDPNASWADVMKRYEHMFKVNKEQGSFYLQSKVYRAWECLDEEYSKEGKKSPEDVRVQQQEQQQSQQEQEK